MARRAGSCRHGYPSIRLTAFVQGGDDSVKKFLTKNNDPYMGRVDVYGVPLPDAAKGPNYVRYDTVDEISFSFLQWQPGDAS